MTSWLTIHVKASSTFQLEGKKQFLSLYRKCHVEPFQDCAPQTLRSSHSLKMHEQLYRLGHESSQGYIRASCYLFLPFLCLLTHQQPEHFSCESTRWSQRSRRGRHQKLRLHIDNKSPSLPDYLSRGAITVLPPPKLICLTWLTAWRLLTHGQCPVLTCFDAPHPLSTLSALRDNKDIFFIYFDFFSISPNTDVSNLFKNWVKRNNMEKSISPNLTSIY